jgi:TonB family protein
LATAFAQDRDSSSELPNATAPSPQAAESLIVLSRDGLLLESLQAVASAHRIQAVSSEEELVIQLVNDHGGVAVIDTDAIATPAIRLIEQLKTQFPDLVLVVAGNSQDQMAFAAQIATGAVYRFLHKPLSVQRVRLFVDAAWRRHGEELAGIVGLAQTQPVPTIRPRGIFTFLRMVAVLVALAAGALWLAVREPQRTPSSDPAPAIQTVPQPAFEPASVDIPPPEIPKPASIQVSPPLEPDAKPIDTPVNPKSADSNSIDQHRLLAERLVGEARKALQASDVNEGERWMQAARASGASEQDMDTLSLEAQRVRLALRADEITRLSQQFSERLDQNRLVEPANDSAKFYLAQLKQIEADHPSTRLAQQTLAARLVDEARSFVPRQDLAAARRWLVEARSVGASTERIAAVEHEILASQQTVTTRGAVANASAPIKVHHVDPEYPAEARKLGLSGWVDLALTAQPDGSVADVAVVRASPPGVFDKSAIAAVRRWRYAPYEQDAQVPWKRTKVQIRFQLK